MSEPTEVDRVLQELREATSFVQDVKKERAVLGEEVKRVAAAVEGAQDELKEIRRDRAIRAGQDDKIRIREGRLAGYSALDLAILHSVWTEQLRTDGLAPQDSPLLAEVSEARKSIANRLDYETVFDWAERAEKAGYEIAGRRANRRFADNVSNWRADLMGQLIQRKAMDSTTTAKGDELVPTFEAAELWMDVNLATTVLPVMKQIPMPTTPYDVPRQFGDTNWYPISENVQSLTSDLTTGKNTLTAYGIKTGVPFSDELTEDSIVPFIPTLRTSLVRNAAEIIDDVLLNADTTTTNNINADGSTIATDTAGKAQWLLGFDGLIHLPLVDNTSQAVDVNLAVSANGVYNAALRKLGKYAAASQRGDVVFVGDVNTVIASLAIEEVETVDKLGIRATISTGELASVYGVPLIVSGKQLLADTDGKVTAAGNVANTGRILCFNTTQWYVGFRRGITLEPDREPGKGQTTLYVSMRPALVARGAARSSATHTSLAYDITSVS